MSNSYSYMHKVADFGLLRNSAKVLGSGLLAGSLFGVGYTGAKAFVDDKYTFDKDNLSDEVVSNAVATGLSGTGMYLAGKGIRKIQNIV